ncbi:helix-turn-helix domain-containing protein [Streptosporangium saharense]|uniref:helix-turn-helix domain-containing protein n=1 Tax=Streptosporangium saharense TaxID=1706840 RepID=UPI00369B8742
MLNVEPDGTFALGSGDTDRLLTPGEVARVFGVDPKTVSRWASTGRTPSVKTPSGQYRYPEHGVRELLEN